VLRLNISPAAETSAQIAESLNTPLREDFNATPRELVL